jgi:hypothetical protein
MNTLRDYRMVPHRRIPFAEKGIVPFVASVVFSGLPVFVIVSEARLRQLGSRRGCSG